MASQLARTLVRTTSLVALCAGAAMGAHAQTVINGGGSTLAQPTYQTEFSLFTSSNPTVSFTYAGSGSGGGQKGFLNNDCTFGGYQTCSPTFTVDFGASDAFLSSTQVSGYTLAATDGPLIQIPMIGVPITIPFRNSKITKGPSLSLTDAQLCGVFSGKLTDWSQISKAAAPGAITVVYRADGSGTSFLLTQHLAAVCNASNSNFTGTLAANKNFNGLFANNTPPANFVGCSQSSGVAACLLASPSAIGYLSPDYTSIAPKSPNTTSLVVASLVNATNLVAYQPTTANTTTGLAAPGAGSTNASPPVGKTNAANPLNWVPSLPVTTKGYPIVGYTVWVLSQCYKPDNAAVSNKSAVATDTLSFLSSHFNNASYKAIISNNGFVSVSNSAASKYVGAISSTFLTNSSKYNLNVQNTTVCTGTTTGTTFQGR